MNDKESLTLRVEKALLEIRPYLEADGGDISLIEITDANVARVRFLGACKSCSMNIMTLKAGIEDTIRRNVPEIVEVCAEV